MKKLSKLKASMNAEQLKLEQMKEELQASLEETIQERVGLNQEFDDHLKNLRTNLVPGLIQDFTQSQLGMRQLADRIEILAADLPLVLPNQPQADMLVRRIDWLGQHNQKQQDSNHYSMYDLPFHTRDKDWLAHYTTDAINRYRTRTRHVTLAEIQDIVETPVFDQACRDMEQRLVKGYITLFQKNMMPDQRAVSNGDNTMWEYDEHFRNDVITAVCNLGLDQHTAEVGLERNAKMWREKAMLKTFNEYYYPASQSKQFEQVPSALADKWTATHDVYEATWLMCRENEYYQKHKHLIDALGTATSNMPLSPRQLAVCQKTMDKCDQNRTQMLTQIAASEQPNERGL